MVLHFPQGITVNLKYFQVSRTREKIFEIPQFFGQKLEI